MYNFLDKIKNHPTVFRQLAIDDQLVSEFNCPLDTKKEDMWSNQGYFVYVIEGKKIWHIPGQAFEMTPGKCIFVKKGAHIVEQFFDARFCVVVFFVSDEFITKTLRDNPTLVKTGSGGEQMSQIAHVDADDTLHAFFNSIVPYFLSNSDVNKALLELKFRELVLNVIANKQNRAVTDYFLSLLTTNQEDSLRRIMEENFCYNLKLEDYARMCNRSLSAFKRDFESFFNKTPGKWLLERRLQHAKILLNTSGKSVSEVAFDSGFENASHFSRTFKEHFGSAPANFQAKNLVTLKKSN